MSDIPNNWSNRENYESFMGQWSRQIASKFLTWLEIDHEIKKKNWLDVGCGTGALSYEIFDTTDANRILGIDPVIEYLSSSNLPRLEFKLGTAELIPTPDFEIDFVVSGLAFNFMPDLNKSLNEMISKLKLGGIIALYVWDYASKMEYLRFFWDAVVENDKSAISLDEGKLFSFCNPTELKNIFAVHELKNIISEVIDIPAYFRSFDEFWEPFLGGQGPAGTYIMSCSSDQLDRIKSTLRNNLPIDQDGSITLNARAYAIQGMKVASN